MTTQRHKSHTTGIIGDGQLALMLAESLVKQGKSFLCLSKSEQSPMKSFSPENVTSDPDLFRENCHVFTLENEFHSLEDLKDLLRHKIDGLFPTLSSYKFFADKISQRTFYDSLGINGPRWMPLTRKKDLSVLLSRFSFPFVLKTSKGGYDGKGVRVVRSNSDLEPALKDFQFDQGAELLAEELVKIHAEVAQGFLRNSDGQFTFLPLVETIQEDGVCNLVQYPSLVTPNVKAQIEFYLEKLISSGLVGIFNFEFFVDESGCVLINEGAPRTHNSQHLTLDASSFSQFDLLAMYLTDATKAPRTVSTMPAVMVNILGKSSGAYGPLKLPEFPVKYSAKLYGKESSKPGRKLGHVNLIDETGRTDLLSLGRKILKEYEL